MSDSTGNALPVYVIHMESQPKRWETLKNRLSRFMLLNPIVVDAVDGNAISEEDRLVGIHWSYPCRTGLPGMTAGEFGCALSHLKAWTELHESGATWGAVFEDDVLLSDRLEDAIRASAPLLETQDPTIVLLSTNVIVDRKVATSIGGFSFHSLVSGAGAYAYLLNRCATERMIERIRPFRNPVDWWRPKLGWGIRVFAIVPHVASYAEDRSDSLLEGPRQAYWRSHSAAKRSVVFRLCSFLFQTLPSVAWHMKYHFGRAVLAKKSW